MHLTINIYNNTTPKTEEEQTEQLESCISTLNVFQPENQPDIEITSTYILSLFAAEISDLTRIKKESVLGHFISYLLEKNK